MIHINSYNIIIHSITPSTVGVSCFYELKYESENALHTLHLDEQLFLKIGGRATLICDRGNPVFLVSEHNEWIYIGTSSLYPYYNNMDIHIDSVQNSPFKEVFYYMLTTGAMQILSVIVVAALMFVLSYSFIGKSAYLVSVSSVLLAGLFLGRAKKSPNSPLSSIALKKVVMKRNKTVQLATLPCSISIGASLIYFYVSTLTPDVMATIIFTSVAASCFVSFKLLKLTYLQHMPLNIPYNYSRLFWQQVSTIPIGWDHKKLL